MNDQIEDTSAVLPSWLNLGVAAWGALVIAASLSGLLGALSNVFMPGFAILVAGGILIPTVSYFALPFVRKAVDAIGHRRLTLFTSGEFRLAGCSSITPIPANCQLCLLFWPVSGMCLQE
jgi:hypothetical protein